MMVRHRLLDRLDAPHARIVLLHAPAGYGKSVLARQYAAAAPATATCDCYDVQTPYELATRVLSALGSPAIALDDGGLEIATTAWQHEAGRQLFIFENAEAIAKDDRLRQFFLRLIANQPPSRTVLVCSRSRLWLPVNRFIPPHVVVRLGSDDLAFTRDEVEAIAADLQLSPFAVERIAAVSRGWPIVVLLLTRLAREGDLEALLARGAEVESDELSEYFAAEIVKAMPPETRAVLELCAAFPIARLEDLHVVFGIEEHRAQTLLADLPLITITAAGTIEVHPIARAMLHRAAGASFPDLLLRAADAWTPRDPVRAAEFRLHAGDADAASRLIATAKWPIDGAVRRIATRLPPAALVHAPVLLVAAFAARRTFADPAVLLDELQQFITSVATDPASRAMAQVMSIGLALEAGRVELAQQLLAALPVPPDFGTELDTIHYMRAYAAAHAGRLHETDTILERLGPHYTGIPFYEALLDQMRATWVSRARGDREHERLLFERAIAGFSAALQLDEVAGTLVQATIGAWLAGEDDAVHRYLAQLQPLIPADATAFHALSVAFAGRVDDAILELIPRPDWRAYAALAMASRAGAESPRFARAALDAARRSAQPFIEAVAAVALAAVSPSDRDAALRRATTSAAAVASVGLASAVSAVRDGRSAGMLGPLLARMTRSPSTGKRVDVRFLDVSVHVDGRPCDITDKQLELLFLLASRRHGLGRQELLDVLWPELNAAAARDAFKSCLYRLRRRVPDVVRYDARFDRYAVGDAVDVDLEQLTLITARLAKGSVAAGDADEFRAVLTAIQNGDRSRARSWDWFAPIAHRIADRAHRAAAHLARTALREERYGEALDLAHLMIDADPTDEEAREIAISAHLAGGDVTAARREYRIYRDLLRAELDTEPSEHLRELLASTSQQRPRESVASASE